MSVSQQAGRSIRQTVGELVGPSVKLVTHPVQLPLRPKRASVQNTRAFLRFRCRGSRSFPLLLIERSHHIPNAVYCS